MDMIVSVEHSWQFKEEAIHKLIVGRSDPATGDRPDIDLGAFHAYENGVSRRHAAIICHGGELFITDLDSSNGTYLNGMRLFPHQPRLLSDGDEIRIGRATLHVKFPSAYKT